LSYFGTMEERPPEPAGQSDLDSRWRLRETEWRRKLGRLHLGVEPIEEQLARYRRVTWALTLLPLVIGSIFLILFTVFGRPDIGLILITVLLLTIGAGAWLEHALLARRARRYLAERTQYLREKERPCEEAPERHPTSEPG
jgi:hypothetical protein